MSLYTPKNYPWKPTTGYESINAYLIPPHPIVSQCSKPCYVPPGMITKPLKFPNLVTGFDRNPIHAATAALSTRYECNKWYENQKSLLREVSTNLQESKPIRENLENLVKEQKEKLKALTNMASNKIINEILKEWQENISKLSAKMTQIIRDCEKVQECKRELQLCVQNVEAPLQISQECLCYRESRNKSELVRDHVEKALMRETETFRQFIKDFEKCLERCEYQMLQGRKMQNDLENFIRSLQWIVCVDKSEAEIMKLSESESTKEQMLYLLKVSDTVINNLHHFQKQMEGEINEITQNILRIWTETNDLFDVRCQEIEIALKELASCLDKIKNEIFEVEKNLKYLKANREEASSRWEDLQRADDQLESLLRTKVNLERDISYKTNSLFIDKHKCMAMRNSYPVSIITER